MMKTGTSLIKDKDPGIVADLRAAVTGIRIKLISRTSIREYFVDMPTGKSASKMNKRHPHQKGPTVGNAETGTIPTLADELIERRLTEN